MKKIISYSLWGNQPKYVAGAIKNAKNNAVIYPDFISRFYVDLIVPKDAIFYLEEMYNTEVIQRDLVGDWRFSLQRFLPFSEKDVEYFISRDCDSRCSVREKSAVDEWIKSGKDFHIMRDHPFHGNYPILAGMFGSKGGLINNIEEIIQSENLNDMYHSDQFFLQKYIFPLVKNSCLVHDEFFEKKQFPLKRNELEFVGEPLTENDLPCDPSHREILKAAIK